MSVARIDASHTACVRLFPQANVGGITAVCWSPDPRIRLPRKVSLGAFGLCWCIPPPGPTFESLLPFDIVVYRPGGCRFDLWCYEG